jgi:transcription elongation factor Elf1
MTADNIPTTCAYCGQQGVISCSDRIDTHQGGENITVLRCIFCGRDA